MDTDNGLDGDGLAVGVDYLSGLSDLYDSVIQMISRIGWAVFVRSISLSSAVYLHKFVVFYSFVLSHFSLYTSYTFQDRSAALLFPLMNE